jgi:hypothetical protein
MDGERDETGEHGGEGKKEEVVSKVTDTTSSCIML